MGGSTISRYGNVTKKRRYDVSPSSTRPQDTEIPLAWPEEIRQMVDGKQGNEKRDEYLSIGVRISKRTNTSVPTTEKDFEFVSKVSSQRDLRGRDQCTDGHLHNGEIPPSGDQGNLCEGDKGKGLRNGDGVCSKE